MGGVCDLRITHVCGEETKRLLNGIKSEAKRMTDGDICQKGFYGMSSKEKEASMVLGIVFLCGAAVA